MPRSARFFPVHKSLALLLLSFWCTSQLPAAPRFEAVPIPGKTLAGNPLADPHERRAAVFTPDLPGKPAKLSTVYYLPGYGGSSENFLGFGGSRFAAAFQEFSEKYKPVRIVVLDCRNRWGGSQYLNSPAQGNYADYVLKEAIPYLEERLGAGDGERLLAGHSSGGFGALRLAMLEPARFHAVVALSPDTDFEVTHKPIVSESVLRTVSPRQLQAYTAGPDQMVQPSHGLIQLVLGLSAAYAPQGPDKPGQLHWLYDEKGRWRAEVWQMWLAEDPVVIARNKPTVFARTQRIYLDGAEHDEFGAQKGARVLRDVVQAHTNVEFYESPGDHGDHIESRLARGLEWVYGLKPRSIRGR